MLISNSAANSGLHRARPSTMAPRGSESSPAMDSLVPGDFRQTEQDLAAFPQPVLDFLARDMVRVAILRDGQTLADTPGLRTLSESEATAESLATNAVVADGLKAAFPHGVETLEALEAAAETLTRQLRTDGVDNYLGVALSPFTAEALAQARDIPADKMSHWVSAFQTLNQGLITDSPEGIQANYGLVVVPHTYHNGEIVPEVRLNNAAQVTSEYVERSYGLNRSEDRMVLLHDKYLGSPAFEVGNYRLAVHEMGHALDYSLERLVSMPGFGALHRQTVDALFEADKAKLEAMGPKAETEAVFTSDRADDDVREYFAEAVEAYLTPANAEDTFRAGNSHEGLQAKNPQLFGYIAKVMSTDFPTTATPVAPKRSLTPAGIPDPDLEVLRIS